MNAASPSSALRLVEVFSACVLELHRKCRELPVRAFQAFVFEQIDRVVPLDSGFFATGTMQRGKPQPHDYFLYRQPPELMASWDRIKHLDTLAFLATETPGRTFASPASVLYVDAPPVLEHCKRFEMSHLACTAAVARRAGSYDVLSAYRREAKRPFSETERATLELLMPHVVETSRECRISALLRARHDSLQTEGGAAIANRQSIVLEAERGFIDLLVRHYPRWNGPALPRDLGDLASVKAPEKRIVGRLVLTVEPVTDGIVLRVRPLLAVDALSKRERQVAQLFASGESTKEVAAKLEIAPNTVRVHVSRVYEKLGVVNKAELASLLAATQACVG